MTQDGSWVLALGWETQCLLQGYLRDPKRNLEHFSEQSSEVTSSHLHPTLLVETFTKFCPDRGVGKQTPPLFLRPHLLMKNCKYHIVRKECEMGDILVQLPLDNLSKQFCLFYLVFPFLLYFYFCSKTKHLISSKFSLPLFSESFPSTCYLSTEIIVFFLWI